jgi:hypothetical protein
MKIRTQATTLATLAAAAGLCWLASDASARIVGAPARSGYRQPPAPTLELVFEGGLAEPLGEQGDPFDPLNMSYGAGTGYELGFRLRQYLGDHFAVSPAFHYVGFGTNRGVADFPEGANLAYEVATSLYRYSLDLQIWLGSPRSAVRPFLTGGVALAHNRYRDSLQYYQDFRTSMNGPSWSAGLGFKLGVFELTGAYVGNRFETANLMPAGEPPGTKHRHNWDYAIVRLGLAFGAN